MYSVKSSINVNPFAESAINELHNTYTMVVKFDHAIGGLINLLYNPIDKILTQTCFYVFHVVFRANIIDISFIHVSH